MGFVLFGGKKPQGASEAMPKGISPSAKLVGIAGKSSEGSTAVLLWNGAWAVIIAPELYEKPG